VKNIQGSLNIICSLPVMAVSSKNIDLLMKFQTPKYQIWILHIKIAHVLQRRCKIKSALKLAGEDHSGLSKLNMLFT
jgi:hypothetical protein